MTLGWFLVNIVLPIVLPMLGLLLVAWCMPLTDAQKARSRIMTTVEDGQLGWLASAWSAAALYEAVSYMQDHRTFLPWMGGLLFGEFLAVLGAMFLAAGGAITATGSARTEHRHLIGSIIVTIFSAGMFAAVHAAVQ